MAYCISPLSSDQIIRNELSQSIFSQLYGTIIEVIREESMEGVIILLKYLCLVCLKKTNNLILQRERAYFFLLASHTTCQLRCSSMDSMALRSAVFTQPLLLPSYSMAILSPTIHSQVRRWKRKKELKNGRRKSRTNSIE